MILNYLKLFNFRNIKEATIPFSPGINLIVGKNGQGKTNIIEAIYFLSHTKSFRTSAQEDLVMRGEENFSVFGEIETLSGKIDLGIVIKDGKKELLVNSKKIGSIAEYLGRLLCVCFSPTDLMMIKGPPTLRRKFMDRHVAEFHPEVLKHMVEYNRALKSKNSILKSGVTDRNALDSWNLTMARAAFMIQRARIDFVRALEVKADQIHKKLSKSIASLKLTLNSNLPALEKLSVETILAQIESARNRELAQRTALVGPHRDDLIIAVDELDARLYASQGQTRSIVIGLKLGVLELMRDRLEEVPLVLLDDMDSELDAIRREGLFDLIFSNERQIFITGTDDGHLQERLRREGMKHSILKVENGIAIGTEIPAR